MAEILAEVDSFDADITVPSGDDWMDNASEVVAALASKLTNRSRYLFNRTGKLAGDQTWAGANVFTKAITAIAAAINAPALVLKRAAAAGGFWQCLIELRVDDPTAPQSPQRVGLYTIPAGDTVGGFAIVINATYTSGSGWQLVATDKKATALIFRFGDVRIVTVNAGSVPWSAWPQSTLTAYKSVLQVETLQAARGQVSANTDGIGNAQVGYQYYDAPTRWSPIPMGTLYGNARLRADGSVERNSAVSNPSEYDHVWIPIRIPPYCVFRRVNIHMTQLQTSDPDNFQLYKRTGTSPWVAVKANLTPGPNIEVENNYGEVTARLRYTGAADVTVQSNEEWAYRWKVVSGDPASINNRIIGAEVEWIDIGPNNRVG